MQRMGDILFELLADALGLHSHHLKDMVIEMRLVI